MSLRRFGLIALAACTTLSLSACGDGWEPRELRDFVPYHNGRTAGPGVEYVRAYMLQERGPNLERELPKSMPVKEETPPPAAPKEEPIKDSEELFKDIIIK